MSNIEPSFEVGDRIILDNQDNYRTHKGTVISRNYIGRDGYQHYEYTILLDKTNQKIYGLWEHNLISIEEKEKRKIDTVKVIPLAKIEYKCKHCENEGYFLVDEFDYRYGHTSCSFCGQMDYFDKDTLKKIGKIINSLNEGS